MGGGGEHVASSCHNESGIYSCRCCDCGLFPVYAIKYKCAYRDTM